MDFYYDELQFFRGVISRSRENLFFGNYTHMLNTVYPLPVNVKLTNNPSFGLWGDRHHAPSLDIKPNRQTTNFTDCPAIWHLFKVEAAVYPIDDNFNMCGKEGFYKQPIETSIDCELTETISYAFMAIGAGSIVAMYGAAFMVVFFKKMADLFWKKIKFFGGSPLMWDIFLYLVRISSIQYQTYAWVLASAIG